MRHRHTIAGFITDGQDDHFISVYGYTFFSELNQREKVLLENLLTIVCPQCGKMHDTQ
jgi:hypothetical protein